MYLPIHIDIPILTLSCSTKENWTFIFNPNKILTEYKLYLYCIRLYYMVILIAIINKEPKEADLINKKSSKFSD